MSEVTLTRRGQETRDRIVEAAADLVLTRGAHETTLDDVRAATGTSKSQLFHYFPGGKTDLMHAVALVQTQRVLGFQQSLLEHPTGWESLQAWRDGIVNYQASQGCVGGCPIGSLASELAEHDDVMRLLLVSSFEQWQAHIATALNALQAQGFLGDEVDLDDLALATVATVQGGLLLAQTARATRPLEVALDAAIAYLKGFAGRL